MPGRSLDGGLSGRINLFEGSRLVEVLAQVPKEPHTIAISSGVSLLFDFTIRLLGISASLIPPANEVVFVWLKDGLARGWNMGLLRGLLHPQILIDALPTHPDLSSNAGHSDLFGREIMDLLIASDAFLV